MIRVATAESRIVRAENKARHRRPAAHERARYRCFLPDLAGLAGKRRAGPMPDIQYYQEIAYDWNEHAHSVASGYIATTLVQVLCLKPKGRSLFL